MENPSRTIVIVGMILLLAVLFFRGIVFRRLNSSDVKDRALKILYLVGLVMVLLFVVGEALWQTHII